MNKILRGSIQNVIDALVSLQGEIEGIAGDEQEAYDNLPEGIQCGDRGCTMEEAISNLENASSTLEDVIGYLTDAQE